MKLKAFRCVLVFALCAGTAMAQDIDQSRGVDARVDYESLTRIGPWDDRNYQLTQADLQLLADNEEELYVLVPAFFRVELRRERPDMLREGPVQYPRSSLPWFKNRYGGFLVDGRLYKAVTYRDGVYKVDTEASAGTKVEDWRVNKMLDGEVRVTTPEGAAESAIAINPVNPIRSSPAPTARCPARPCTIRPMARHLERGVGPDRQRMLRPDGGLVLGRHQGLHRDAGFRRLDLSFRRWRSDLERSRGRHPGRRSA